MSPGDIAQERLGFDGCYVRARGDELAFLGSRDVGVRNGVAWFVEWKLGVHALGLYPPDTARFQELPVASTYPVRVVTTGLAPGLIQLVRENPIYASPSSQVLPRLGRGHVLEGGARWL